MRERDNGGKFTHQVFTDRICYVCGSNETYVDKTGRHHWANVDGEWFCKRHYQRYFDNPRRNPINSKKWNPITHARYGPRRITFKGKRIYVEDKPRTGKCTNCGKSVGDEYINYKGQTAIIKRTHIHHKQYNEAKPLDDTQELCVSCHGKLKRKSM